MARMEKINYMIDKYHVSTEQLSLLVDVEIHFFHDVGRIVSSSIQSTYQTDPNTLTQKERDLSNRLSILTLFMKLNKLHPLRIEEFEVIPEFWNECFPFYLMLLKPNSFISLELMRVYSMRRFRIDATHEEKYNQFEIVLIDKINSYEILLASLEERGILDNLVSEFSSNPGLVELIQKGINNG
jgi:hypothetical protein